MYEGTWFNDLRHGKGRQEYPNRDVYEGSWELNVVSDQGMMMKVADINALFL